MQYSFSFGALFFGILIMAFGGAIVYFHRQLANGFGSGVGAYDKYKLWGLIVAGVGLIIAINLHTAILQFIFSLFFSGLKN